MWQCLHEWLPHPWSICLQYLELHCGGVVALRLVGLYADPVWLLHHSGVSRPMHGAVSAVQCAVLYVAAQRVAVAVPYTLDSACGLQD